MGSVPPSKPPTGPSATPRTARWSKRFVSTAFALALTLLGPIATASAKERPFRLTGAGQRLFDPQQSPAGPFEAAGRATHLGRWTNEWRGEDEQ